MKTKIIYISGSEIFDVNDVRAAFEEVRGALNLGPDTVMFGVPVDDSDQLAQDTEIKPKKARAKKIVAEDKPENPQSDEPVVPILSVLSGREEPIPTKIEDVILDDEPVVTVCATVAVTTPTIEAEKTLEELLENMAPLKEDEKTDTECDIELEIDVAPTPAVDSDTDETLSRLAAEFADAQKMISDTDDTPPTTILKQPKSSIGKLKNILPFKKAKSDGGALLGDLFGWAGIAANDDDFKVPGFFATAK